MIKRKKRIKLKKRILLSAGVFIIITLLIFKGELANIYMMYSNRPSNDIHIDEASKVEESKVGASKVEASEFDSSYVVAIDAGHGGNDPGTNGYGLLEKDINLDICQRLNEILKAAGISTFMIRDGDDYMGRIDRIQLANSEKTTLFLSIHCDWFEDGFYNGIKTFYNPAKNLKAGNLLEQDYAQNIQNCLVNTLHGKNIGIVPDSELSVIIRANMPSILVEIGFLSNINDSKLLKTDDYRKKSAEALAEGIKLSLKSIK